MAAWSAIVGASARCSEIFTYCGGLARDLELAFKPVKPLLWRE
jgi:hypothetical protein